MKTFFPVVCRNSAIERLKYLSKKIGNKSPEGRIEFASLIYKYNLHKEVSRHQLHDIGIKDRDMDACFEMNDGAVVVYGIMKQAIKDEGMETAIRSDGVWDSWMETYNVQDALLNQPSLAL